MPIGQSVKQALEVLPAKRGPGKRRALGDISNSLATDLSKAFLGFEGKSTKQTEIASRKQAHRAPTDEDIEVAYGGVSKDDDKVYMQGLQKQLDAQVDKWKEEAVALEAEEENVLESFDADVSGLKDTAEKILSAEIPTPPESPIIDKSHELFNVDEYLDFTLVDA